MNKILRKFGKKVKEKRLKAGVSQEKLGELSGLHRTYISGIERGIRNVSLKNIWKISKALGVKLKDLFDFDHSHRLQRSATYHL